MIKLLWEESNQQGEKLLENFGNWLGRATEMTEGLSELMMHWQMFTFGRIIFILLVIMIIIKLKSNLIRSTICLKSSEKRRFPVIFTEIIPNPLSRQSG